MFRRSSQKSTPAANELAEPRRLPKFDAHHSSSIKTTKAKVKSTLSLSDKENDRIQKELARIDAMELSDADSPEWTMAKEDFLIMNNKRLLTVNEAEASKRKVCNIYSKPRRASN